MATSTEDKKSEHQRQQEAILDKLAELGGSRVKDDDLEYGDRLVLPRTMSLPDTIEFLEGYMERENEMMTFVRSFRYRPWDGAMALHRAVYKVFGTRALAKSSFFHRPQTISIEVGPGQTEQVPWGNFYAPMFGEEASIMVAADGDEEYGMIFQLGVTCKRKFAASVEGLFQMVQKELETASIYRGKAINGKSQPEFLDLSTVDPTRVVFSEDTGRQLEANLWAMLRYTERMVEQGIPLKRAVLLEGPYGTGKTLCGFLTAQIAVDNGWGFIMCRPGRDDLMEVMQTARLYQPCVVFFEDVDVVAEGESDDRDSVTTLLDLMDGISAKGTQILAVLTTNHVEKIHKGMVRPGRLDAIVHIGKLDAQAFRKLAEQTIGASLAESIEWTDVAEAMDGFLPAFVVEACNRAQRYSIAANGGDIGEIGTTELVDAATGLRPQLDLMDAAKEGRPRDRLTEAMADVVKAPVKESIDQTKVYDYDGDPEYTLAVEDGNRGG